MRRFNGDERVRHGGTDNEQDGHPEPGSRRREQVGVPTGGPGRLPPGANARERRSLERNDAGGDLGASAFSQLFHAAPIPSLVLGAADFEILAVNEAFLGVSGAERDELVGRGLFSVLPAEPTRRYSVSRNVLREALQGAATTGKAVTLPLLRFDRPLENGASEERWWRMRLGGVKDREGVVTRLVVQIEEVPRQQGPGSEESVRAGQESADSANGAEDPGRGASDLPSADDGRGPRPRRTSVSRYETLDAFRVRIDVSVRAGSTAAEVQAATLAVLRDAVGAPVACFGELDEDAAAFVITTCDSEDEGVELTGMYPLSRGAIEKSLLRGGNVTVNDLGTEQSIDASAREALLAQGVRSLVAVPVDRTGRRLVTLAVYDLKPRQWIRHEVALVEEAARRAWPFVERAGAEERLRSVARGLQRLVQDAPFGIYVVDDELRFVEASKAAVQAFGMGPLQGVKLEQALGTIWLEDFRTEAMEHFRHTLETGEPFTSTDTVERRADRGVDEAYDWRLERIALPNGRVGVVCYFYDLTERRNLEALIREREEELRELNASLERQVIERTEELRLSEARFREAFAAGPVAACITSVRDDTVLAVNDSFEQLTGYRQRDAVGRKTDQIGLWAGPEDRERIARASKRAGTFRDLQLQVVTKGGDTIDVLASSAKIDWSGEEARLKMFIDDTARRRSQVEVERAIQDVMTDAAWFSRKIVERLSRPDGKKADDKPVKELTQRERQVLSRMAMGLSDKAIAKELGLAAQTVRNHVARVYAKLKVHSRSQAIVWARERGVGGKGE